jgi:hypothetical protein
VLAVPALGQVPRDVPAAVPGGPCGDVDQVAADGGAAGLGKGEAGQRPGGRSRLCAMAAKASQTALAGKDPGGRWASGPSVQSAKTCSVIAWSRCWASAWASSNGELVNTAW